MTPSTPSRPWREIESSSGRARSSASNSAAIYLYHSKPRMLGSRSEGFIKLASEGTEIGRSAAYPSSVQANSFAFKLQDKKGLMHRFNCDTRSLTELITCILQRVGDDIDRNHLPQILYEDEEHDKVVLASDGDLVAAVDHARLAGWKFQRKVWILAVRKSQLRRSMLQPHF